MTSSATGLVVLRLVVAASRGGGGFSEAADCAVVFLLTCRHSARFSVFDTVPRPDVRLRSVAVVTSSEDDDVSRPLLTERGGKYCGGTVVARGSKCCRTGGPMLAVVVVVSVSGRRAGGTVGTLSTQWLLVRSALKICRLWAVMCPPGPAATDQRRDLSINTVHIAHTFIVHITCTPLGASRPNLRPNRI